MSYVLLYLLVVVLLVVPLWTNAQECERLKASLTYTQEEAPKDLSGVVRFEPKCSVCDDRLAKRLRCLMIVRIYIYSFQS